MQRFKPITLIVINVVALFFTLSLLHLCYQVTFKPSQLGLGLGQWQFAFFVAPIPIIIGMTTLALQAFTNLVWPKTITTIALINLVIPPLLYLLAHFHVIY